MGRARDRTRIFLRPIRRRIRARGRGTSVRRDHSADVSQGTISRMTFAAFPAWLAWIAIAAAIGAGVWLFLLKVRSPRIVVPSMTLWRRVLDETRDITLWERIRKAVSLAIAVLITLALA